MKNLVFVFLFIPLWAKAQSNGAFGFRYDQSPGVTVAGKTLRNAWVGGLNATQYATMRLNDDTRDDLVVFDRVTRKLSTFVAVDNPTGSGVVWQYAPEYEPAFPRISSWVLLVDYDGDGRNDLFTDGPSSIRLFRNESAGGRVVFKLVADPLMTEGFGGQQVLYAGSTDLSAITDFDDDGDIDILAFDPTGDQISYNQNMSVERTGKRDGLDFKRTSGQCWGGFQKNFCNDFSFGLNCGGTLPNPGRVAAPIADVTPLVGVNPGRANPGRARPLHSGNTLTVVDTDGDGNKDLLFGFVTCENLARIRGGGPNTSNARFTGFDSLFPTSKPILFPAFPAVFWEDVDGDGQRDLIASPNVNFNDNNAFDFRASGWFYKNVGNNQKPDFKFVQSDFLQSDMLDLGENATPALADLDGDGDMDMLVGFAGTATAAGYRAGLWQFENQGTAQKPAFVLITTDYLGLGQTLKLTGTLPQLLDLDGNGSLDLVLAGTGARAVEMRAFLNAAPKGTAVRFEPSQAINWPVPNTIQIGERPNVVDVDRDGLPDLLVGKNDGTISYFRNEGSVAAPVFQLRNQQFGGILPGIFQSLARSLAVADLNGDQKRELVSTSNDGQVRIFAMPDQPDQSGQQPLTLLDSLPALGLAGTGLVAALADLDGDQLPDLMLGSRGGGLRYLKNTAKKIIITAVEPEPTGPWAFPNPADRYLTIRAPHSGQVELIAVSGQTVLPAQPVRVNVETLLDVGQLPNGTYLLRLTATDRPALVQKVVVWK